MNRNVIHRAIVTFAALALVAASGIAPAVRGDESPTVPRGDSGRAAATQIIATQIRDLVEQLQAVRRQRRETDEQHRESLARFGRQIDMLQSQLEPSKRAVADQRSGITELERSIADNHKSAADASAWIVAVADRVAPFAEHSQRRIERSAAEDATVRAADMADAIKLLRDDDPQHRSEGASDALRLVGEGWLAARTVSVKNEPIVLDGGNRLQHAWVYRLGLASKAFISEDGQTIGLWSGDPRSPWRTDLTEAERTQIRNLVDVAREEQPPAVVPVPILLAPTSAAGE